MAVACGSMWAAECGNAFTLIPPLTYPFSWTYSGAPGGLYPGGTNLRPNPHEALGKSVAAGVLPRNSTGRMEERYGRIVLLSLGLSDAAPEFLAFRALAAREAERNPQVTIVDGALAGWSADRIVSESNTYWAAVEQRLRAAGSTAAQVQVIWIKVSPAEPREQFPQDARTLQLRLRSIVQTLPRRFPNVRLAYFSSRAYGGYAAAPVASEPYAYQAGFAVKWVIEERLGRDDQPWLAWGPYLWADGMNARLDGLSWQCADFAEDGVSASEPGNAKAARILLDFFKTDSTTRLWFLRPSKTPVPVIRSVVNAASLLPDVSNYSIASILGEDLAAESISAPGMPLPLILGGTRVEVGPEVVPLYFAGGNQINFLMPVVPWELTVTVIRGETRSAPFLVPMQPAYAPGLFNLEGVAVAQRPDGSQISAESPAQRGETIGLFGTGVGLRNPASQSPESLAVVSFGEVTVPAARAGYVSGAPGLFLWIVSIPQNAPVGAAVPVRIQYGASGASNAVALAIN